MNQIRSQLNRSTSYPSPAKQKQEKTNFFSFPFFCSNTIRNSFPFFLRLSKIRSVVIEVSLACGKSRFPFFVLSFNLKVFHAGRLFEQMNKKKSQTLFVASNEVEKLERNLFITMISLTRRYDKLDAHFFVFRICCCKFHVSTDAVVRCGI